MRPACSKSLRLSIHHTNRRCNHGLCLKARPWADRALAAAVRVRDGSQAELKGLHVFRRRLEWECLLHEKYK